MTELERTEHGTVAIAPGALTRLVVQAAGQVEGIRVRRPRRSLRVQVSDGKARAALELSVRRGLVVPQVAGDVQARVADALRAMLEVDVEAVDVSVEEIA